MDIIMDIYRLDNIKKELRNHDIEFRIYNQNNNNYIFYIKKYNENIFKNFINSVTKYNYFDKCEIINRCTYNSKMIVDIYLESINIFFVKE